MKFKIKSVEKLKDRLISHYNLYKKYHFIGKLRAEGKLSLKGRLVYERNMGPGQFGYEQFTIKTPVDDKSQPHFKGQCQAIGTGDVFNVAAWINKEGNIRFEIYETEGYAIQKPNPTPHPF